MNPCGYNKLPKILMVGPIPPLIGGISTYISDLLSSNLNKEFTLIHFTTNRPTNKKKVPTSHNYKVIVSFSSKHLMKSIFVTVYHLLSFPFVVMIKGPDLVHIHTSSYWSFLENSFYILISKLFGKKVVIHIHGSDFDNYYLTGHFLMKRYIRFIMANADRVVALSEYWKKFFDNGICLDSNKVIVIRNGVISSKFKKQLNTTDLNSVEYVNVLFFGGMDAKRKGAYDVVKAIPLVVNQFPNTIFTFIGKGQMEVINEMCNNLGIVNNVQILGEVSESVKIETLNSSDIFLLPSYAEGLPISILEAMAAGLPVISTTVGAIPEVIEDGVNGYLINPGDYRALAEKILLLLKNYNLRLEIGLNNVKEIRDNYDMQVVTEKIKNVYSQLT